MDRNFWQKLLDAGINITAGVTKPFAMGANILAQGYGDLYRGLSGNIDYASPLEEYIKSGISQEEMSRINDNPYKEILKSGAGMAATLAPMATGGVFTNAATRGTRAFSGLNPTTNPLVNQLSQILARGGLEGGLGGFGYSREGKELQDTITGIGAGVGGEFLGEYLLNKSFRDLLNENVSRGAKMGYNKLRGYGQDVNYKDLLNGGSVEVSAQSPYSRLLDKTDKDSPQMIGDYNFTEEELNKFMEVYPFDDEGVRLINREIEPRIIGVDEKAPIRPLGNTVDKNTRLIREYMNDKGVPEPITGDMMDEQMKELANRYKNEGIPGKKPGLKDGTVRQPNVNNYKPNIAFGTDSGEYNRLSQMETVKLLKEGSKPSYISDVYLDSPEGKKIVQYLEQNKLPYKLIDFDGKKIIFAGRDEPSLAKLLKADEFGTETDIGIALGYKPIPGDPEYNPKLYATPNKARGLLSK